LEIQRVYISQNIKLKLLSKHNITDSEVKEVFSTLILNLKSIVVIVFQRLMLPMDVPLLVDILWLPFSYMISRQKLLLQEI